MALHLTIDEGNSSTKVALWRDDQIVALATRNDAEPDFVHEVLADCPRVDAAIFCSVRGDRRARALETLSDVASRVLYLDADTPGPLKIDYRTPGTLGADRIAAATGAQSLFPGEAALVVDMGTAITYDVVSSDGRFLGGNIAPGIFVRLEALNHYTKALPLIDPDGNTPRWGYDTETALRAGAVRGVVGELQYYRHCLGAAFPDPRIVITGGSADLIAPYITSSTVIEPRLVLIGLNAILNYNENL